MTTDAEYEPAPARLGPMYDTGGVVDVTAPIGVEVEIRDDGKVVWVNIDGICRLRACRIGQLIITDHRK